MRDIKLIIFDLDGTLVNAYPAIIASFNYTMRQLGYSQRNSVSIRRAVGWGDENLLRPFFKESDLKKALFIYRRHHKKALLKGARLFSGAIKILDYLKHKGYKLAVASNRPTRFSWILIRHLKIKKYFNYVLCADKLKYIKPHPYILRKIIQKFQLKPGQAFYVGDMIIDALAGRRAKIKTMIVTTGSSSPLEIKKEKPYRIIGKLSELYDIL